MIAQGNVNDAAFIGGHRFKSLTAAALGNLLCHALRHLDQLLFTPATISFYINSQLHELARLLANDQ